MIKKNGKILLIACVLIIPIWFGVDFLNSNLDKFLTAQISEPLESIVSFDSIQEKEKIPPEIDALASISVRINPLGKSKILFSANSDKKLPIASITKLMTALVILENPKYFDFSSIVTVSKEAASQAKTSNYGNLQEGEQYTFEKLIELMLVYSSNHAAFALAETIGVDNFVLKMNEKALELSMENTRFFNPTGLDSDNLNYSTTNDLIILNKYLLKNQPEIFNLTAEPHESFFVENGISLLYLPEGSFLIGGKTGYTIAAGGCMDYIFEDQNGNVFMNIILGTNDAEIRIIEMQKIINWI